MVPTGQWSGEGPLTGQPLGKNAITINDRNYTMVKALGVVLFVLATIVNTYAVYGDKTRFKKKYTAILLIIVIDLLLIIGAVYCFSIP